MPGPNKDFSMVPWSLTADPRVSMTAKSAYAALLRFALGSGVCRAPIASVALACGGIDTETLRRAVAELEQFAYARRLGPRGARFAVEVLPVPEREYLENEVLSTPKTRYSGRVESGSTSKTRDEYLENEGPSTSKMRHSGDPILLERIKRDKKSGGGDAHARTRGTAEKPGEQDPVAASIRAWFGDQFPYAERFALEAEGWYRAGATPDDVLSAIRLAEAQDPPVAPKSLASFVAACLPRVKARRLAIEAVTPESIGPVLANGNGIAPHPTLAPGPKLTKGQRDAIELERQAEAMRQNRIRRNAAEAEAAEKERTNGQG